MRLGSFVSPRTPFKSTAADPWRGLPEIGTPFDPAMGRAAGFVQVPLLNPNGANFRVWPDEDGACILMIEAEGHPMHGMRMRLSRGVALRLSQSLLHVAQGQSSGNPGVLLDHAGNPTSPLRR